MNTQKVVVEMSDKLERDAEGKVIRETVKVKNEKGEEKEIQRNKVKEAGKKYEVSVSAPTVSDFTPEQLAELLQNAVIAETRAYARQCEKDGVEPGEFALTVSDMLGARIEIPDALVETVQGAFDKYLATAGKQEKARKNNLALLVAGVNVLTKTDSRMISGYENNLTAFAASLEGDSVGEFAPVLDRAAKRLEKAKAANKESLV